MSSPTGKPPAGPAVAAATSVAKPAGQAPMAAVKPPAFKIEGVGARQRYLKLLVYGTYGVGKTLLAATASKVPQMNDTLMISAESGDLTIEGFENIDLVSCQDLKTVARVYEFLQAHCKARDVNDEAKLIELETKFRGDGAVVTKPKRYRTVIIDTLSEVEAYSFNQLLGVTTGTKLEDEGNPAEFKEYKQNHTIILRLVRSFRDLPMHVIFTCASQYSQDEVKRYKYFPDLTGKLSAKVQGFMDMVGYYESSMLEGGIVVRKLHVVPTGKFDAKHRYSKFKGTFFQDPTIEKILKDTGLLEDMPK